MVDDAAKPALDPRAIMQRAMATPLPKRFYTAATVEARDGAHVVLLDGRPARTPQRNLLALPTAHAGLALAAEWNAQGETIDPAAMPLTRIVNSALDGVAGEMEAVRAEIVKYSGSDLVCYRADEPAVLAAMQAAAWDPVLAWARDALGARFTLGFGVIHVMQPEAARAAVAAEVSRFATPIPLAALNVMTTLTGSALLALGVARGRLAAQEAWAAAHVDEDFQASRWGADEEAALRRANRWREMDAAALAVQFIHQTDRR